MLHWYHASMYYWGTNFLSLYTLNMLQLEPIKCPAKNDILRKISAVKFIFYFIVYKAYFIQYMWKVRSQTNFLHISLLYNGEICVCVSAKIWAEPNWP